MDDVVDFPVSSDYVLLRSCIEAADRAAGEASARVAVAFDSCLWGHRDHQWRSQRVDEHLVFRCRRCGSTRPVSEER